jgi:arylsulfatase A-like enzyme
MPTQSLCRVAAAALTWAAAWCGGLAADEPVTPGRPNVLFIVADDLNRMIGCYGDTLAKTPNLDRLAARGVRFERAYCTFPLCGPSRNSFLTGLHPNATGIFTNEQIFRQSIPGQVSLPQAFRQAGYFAGRIGKLYHYNVPRSIGTDGHDDPASWELELNPAGCDRLEEEPEIFSLAPGQFGGTLSWYASPKSDPHHTDGMIARDAAWVLERCARDRSRPFFLAVGFFRPHTPFVAPRDPYFDWHPEQAMPVVTGVADDQRDLPAAAIASTKREEQAMSDELRRQCRQAYAASISFMDAQVGRVIDALDRLGLADDTVIVFTSDHGYHMGEHGLWQKKSLFEESAGVPLVIVAPEVTQPGGVAAAPVSQVDLYPTLAELCGVPAPNNLQGQSLVPILGDPARSGRGWALTQVRRGGKGGEFFGYALSTPRYRYTEWDEGRAGRELYDRQADPQEVTNLAESADHAGLVAELSGRLAAAVADSFPPDGKPPEVKHGGWEVILTR